MKLSWFVLIVILTANITIGYVVAPVLFSQLTSEQAGNIMSVLLNQLYWVDMLVGLSVLVFLMVKKQCAIKREIWLSGFVAFTALNSFWVSPVMENLKVIKEPVKNAMTFAQWHGISQIIFLVAWIMILTWLFLASKQLRVTDGKSN